MGQRRYIKYEPNLRKYDPTKEFEGTAKTIHIDDFLETVVKKLISDTLRYQKNQYKAVSTTKLYLIMFKTNCRKYIISWCIVWHQIGPQNSVFENIS